MTVSSARPPKPGLLREGRFNLSSPTTRNSWVKALDEREMGPDWYGMFEAVCARSVRRWRQGEPMVDLADVEVSDELPYLLHPFVVEGAASVLFADGASGKSLVALACAVSVATGEEIIPGVLPVRCGPVIYWDWEWDAESHAERLKAICAGAGIDVPRNMIFYQREMTSMLEALPRMRKRVAETSAVFSCVDSLGFARGGEPNSAELTTRCFTGLRTLTIPSLVLDHVSKEAKERSNSDSSFGSIYTRNSARIMWRLDAQKEEGQDNFYTALVNTKANRKTQKPRGMTVSMQTDENERLISVRFEPADVREIPGLNKTSSLSDQITSVIQANNGRPMYFRDIAEALRVDGMTVTDEVVRVTLHARKLRFVRLEDKWGLLAQNAHA